MKANSFWFNLNVPTLKVGFVGFLLRFGESNRGPWRYELRNIPGMRSTGQYCLQGWCGTFGGVITDVLGLFRVVRIDRSGGCGYLHEIVGIEREAILAKRGYSDIT